MTVSLEDSWTFRVDYPWIRNFKIWGKSGIFWKRNSNVSIGRRVKIKKPLNLSFCYLQLCNLHQSRRSKVKVTFCDPGTFKLKFEYERTLLANF